MSGRPYGVAPTQSLCGEELFDYLSTAMPPGGATLTVEEYLAITSFICHVHPKSVMSLLVPPAAGMYACST